MTPRCVLAGHRNLLFYLFIWLSFMISNWKTIQLDYDVPTPSSTGSEETPSQNFDSFGLNENKQNAKFQTPPTPKRGRKSNKHKIATDPNKSQIQFAETPISGQSTEKGNNKSVESYNSSSQLYPNKSSNQGQNSSKNEFYEINNATSTINHQRPDNASLNYNGTNNEIVHDDIGDHNNITDNYGNYTRYANGSISRNETKSKVNVSGSFSNNSKQNNTKQLGNETSAITTTDENINKTTLINDISQPVNNKTNEMNNASDNETTELNEYKTVGAATNVTNISEITKKNSTANETITLVNLAIIDNAANSNYTNNGNAINGNATRIKNEGMNNATIQIDSTTKISEQKRNLPTFETTIEDDDNHDELMLNNPMDEPLTSSIPTNVRADVTMPYNYRNDKKEMKNRSDSKKKQESESTRTMATERKNKQQASNRLKLSQQHYKTTHKPDLYSSTLENTYGTKHTSQKSTTSDRYQQTTENEIYFGSTEAPQEMVLTRPPTENKEKNPKTEKVAKLKLQKKRHPRTITSTTDADPKDITESTENKYKNKNLVQSKPVREKALVEFDDELKGLCKQVTEGKDAINVPLEFVSFSVANIHFAGSAKKFIDIIPLKNSSVKYIENKFAIGSELEKKYKKWDCYKGSQCDVMCLGITQLISRYVLDIFINTQNNIKQAYRSNVVNVRLINPRTWQIIPTSHLSQPVEYKFKLYEQNQLENFDFKCCVWEENIWNKTACKKIRFENEVFHCECYSLGYTSVFLIDTRIPTTPKPEPVTLSSDIKKQLSNLNKKETRSLVNYKFEIAADYNKTVGNEKKAIEETFKEQIARQLNLTKESIMRVTIAPECDDCDSANDSMIPANDTVQNFTQTVRNLFPTGPGSIKVVVQVSVSSKNNISAEDVHKHLQNKIKNKELVLTDRNNNVLEINPDQSVDVEIEALAPKSNSQTTIIILGVVLAVLIFFLVLLGFAVHKKLKNGKEKILPFNKKLTPYLNPTYKSFHNENTLDGTIESLVRIRRRSDQLLYGFDMDEASWKSGKGAGKSHEIKRTNKSWNSDLRRHSQPLSVSGIKMQQSVKSRTISPPMPGFVDDNSV